MELVGLKKARKERRLSQLQLAMELSISREAISYYENGQRSPDVGMLLKMARYFNVSVDYLITGEEFSPR
ncbi:MAG: helix-turn-helix transcriptional regulator [Clostridia bacterium]|nr:helix-turn-helix transcriptional regulator [Clostridia bacterium]